MLDQEKSKTPGSLLLRPPWGGVMESHLRNTSRFFLFMSVIYFKNVLHLFPYVPLCVCADVCTVVYVWRPEGNSVELVPFLLSTLIWVLGTKHKSPGLLASVFTSWACLPAPCLLFLNDILNWQEGSLKGDHTRSVSEFTWYNKKLIKIKVELEHRWSGLQINNLQRMYRKCYFNSHLVKTKHNEARTHESRGMNWLAYGHT